LAHHTTVVLAGLFLATISFLGVGGDAAATRTGHRSVRSAGCAGRSESAQPASDEHSISVDGSFHEYLERLPTDYRPGKAVSMIVEFHGFGSSALEFAGLTQMPARGSKKGFVVVTPEGPGHTWLLNPLGPDARFVEAVITQVQDSICVDLDHVYAAGFSQGAAFTIFLACAHPGQFAAIATVAVDFRLGCATPLSLLAFHGTADPDVPYQDGGEGLSLPGTKVRGTLLNLSDWAQLDQCLESPILQRMGTDVERRTWPSCAHGTRVILFSLLGGSHTWPGAARSASPLYTTRTISATNLSLDFFARHQRHF
jgi:polyhydroxybutyrate depolymerase